jgi:hypothetical protein
MQRLGSDDHVGLVVTAGGEHRLRRVVQISGRRRERQPAPTPPTAHAMARPDQPATSLEDELRKRRARRTGEPDGPDPVKRNAGRPRHQGAGRRDRPARRGAAPRRIAEEAGSPSQQATGNRCRSPVVVFKRTGVGPQLDLVEHHSGHARQGRPSALVVPRSNTADEARADLVPTSRPRSRACERGWRCCRALQAGDGEREAE